MERVIQYVKSNDFGEIETSIKHFNGEPKVALCYKLKSNGKRQRKLKVLIIEKEDQWYKLNTVLKISKNRYQKVMEIHEDEFEVVVSNIKCIVDMFFEVKRWFTTIVNFHYQKFANNIKVFNDLDFIYGNGDISYRFSLNPGGLLVRVKILKYSKDSVELLQYISENCNMYGGTCLIENTNEDKADIFDKVEGYLEPKRKRVELSDEEIKSKK